jgi:hypothetical protein
LHYFRGVERTHRIRLGSSIEALSHDSELVYRPHQKGVHCVIGIPVHYHLDCGKRWFAFDAAKQLLGLVYAHQAVR